MRYLQDIIVSDAELSHYEKEAGISQQDDMGWLILFYRLFNPRVKCEH